MTQPEPRPAMTMRQIREGLGHKVPPVGIPEATVQPTSYVVSCLPEGHDDRWTFTIQVRYRGSGRFAVEYRLRQYGSDGTWSYEPDWAEDGSDEKVEKAWLAAHRFGHDEALRLARELAPTLTYRGLTVANVLDGEWGAAPAETATPAPAVAPLAACQPSEAPREPDTATRPPTGRVGDSVETEPPNPYANGVCTYGEDQAPGSGCIKPAGHNGAHLVTPGDTDDDL